MSDFLDLIRNLNGGAFAKELDDELNQLVQSAVATSKGGELTVKLQIKPGRGGRIMEVDHSCSSKAPQFQRPTDYLFVTGAGQLVRDNPEQHKLELRDVKEGEKVVANG